MRASGERLHTIGPYRITAELGRGSNAVVYLVQRPDLPAQQYALKLLLHADAEGIARFKQEAKLASRLDEPGIVGVRDVGVHGNHHYLVMDYVQGPDLQARLRQGPLSPGEAAHLVRDLARTMEQAHEAGIVHRDLKPANIILDKALGRARITDFGLARDNHRFDHLTQTNEVLGTPYYMAPEQFRGREIDHTVDVYALGVILYEGLTGRRPFEGRTPLELSQLVAKGTFPTPRQVDPDLPGSLEQICLRAMSHHAGDRYPTCEDLALALDGWLAPTPATATRSLPTRVVVAGSLALLLVAAGVALTGRAATSERQQGAAPHAPSGRASSRAETPQEPPASAAAPPAGAQQDTGGEAWTRAVRRSRELSGQQRDEEAREALSEARRAALNDDQRARIELEALGQHRRRGRYEVAIDATPQSLLGRDDAVGDRARIELALCHLRSGSEGWQPLIDQVIDRGQSGAEGLTALVLGGLLRGSGQGQWLGLLQRALEIDPHYDMAVMSQLFVLRMTGRSRDVPALAERVRPNLEDDPRFFLGLGLALTELNQLPAALSAFERILTLTGPNPMPSALTTHFQLASRLGDHQAARRSMDLALAQHPDDPHLLLWTGLAAWGQGRQVEAARDWRRAATRPLREFQAALARLDAKTGQFVWRNLLGSLRLGAPVLSGEGVGQLEARAKRAPRAARQPLLEALSSAAGGRPWVELAPLFEQALAAAPDSVPVALERVRALVGRDRYPEARQGIQELRERGVSEGIELELSRLEADLTWHQGNRHDCIPAWREVHRRDPSGIEGQIALCEATYASGQDHARALGIVRGVLSEAPDHPRATTLAVILTMVQQEPLQALAIADEFMSRHGFSDCHLVGARTMVAVSLFRSLGPMATPHVHAEWEKVFALTESAHQRVVAASGALRADRLGELDWVERQLTSGLELEPGRARLHESMGALSVLRGAPAEDALGHWARARELDPRTPLEEGYLALFRSAYPDQAERLDEVLGR